MTDKKENKVLKSVKIWFKDWTWINEESASRKNNGEPNWSQAAILAQALKVLRVRHPRTVQPGSTIAPKDLDAIESPNSGEISGERKEWLEKLSRVLESGNEKAIRHATNGIASAVDQVDADSNIPGGAEKKQTGAPPEVAQIPRKKPRRSTGG